MSTKREDVATHRRRFLRLCGIAGTGTIAGCSGGSEDTETTAGDQESSTPTQSPTATLTPTADQTSTATPISTQTLTETASRTPTPPETSSPTQTATETSTPTTTPTATVEDAPQPDLVAEYESTPGWVPSRTGARRSRGRQSGQMTGLSENEMQTWSVQDASLARQSDTIRPSESVNSVGGNAHSKTILPILSI